MTWTRRTSIPAATSCSPFRPTTRSSYLRGSSRVFSDGLAFGPEKLSQTARLHRTTPMASTHRFHWSSSSPYLRQLLELDVRPHHRLLLAPQSLRGMGRSRKASPTSALLVCLRGGLGRKRDHP